MKRKLFTTVALLFCVIVCFAIVADLTGKWTGVVKVPQGDDVTLSYDFKVAGDSLTGTGKSSNGNTVKIYDGKIKGNDFTFKVTTSEGTVIPHAGKFYPEADSVGLDLDANGMKFHTTLKREGK